MKRTILLTLICIQALAACSQSPAARDTAHVGGACEGCEAIYENTIPFEKLNWLLWLPDWNEKGRRLAVNGVVYKADGKTPAPGVVMYFYHTDQTGKYTPKTNATGWAKRHGYIRGWLRTNEKGEYKFFTLKPAAYPGNSIPAHIHVIVKEPGLNAYYIDDFLFDDDPLLTASVRKKQPQRGGNGILKTKDVGNMLKASRDIYLGQHIPNYPVGGKK
jgi:protocatechuate 3,4-dioxygenase beta subunit